MTEILNHFTVWQWVLLFAGLIIVFYLVRIVLPICLIVFIAGVAILGAFIVMTFFSILNMCKRICKEKDE